MDIETTAPPDTSTAKIGERMLRTSGLLWKVNHDLLHPLGLTLAVDVDDNVPTDAPVQLRVLVAEDGVWEFTDDINAAKAADWDNFVTAAPALREAIMFVRRAKADDED